MSNQPEALRLAESLEAWETCNYDAAAELRRLHRVELAYEVWLDKTEWVQETAQAKELGMHRADVLKQRIEDLQSVNQNVLTAIAGVLGVKP